MNRRFAFPVFLFLFLLSGALAGNPLHAQSQFNFSDNCRQAYRHILQWQFAEAQQWIGREKKEHPDNLIPYFLDNYIDFFELFYNEDPAAFRRLLPEYDRRLALMNRGPESSPYRLYCKAVIHFQWAAIYVKFSRNWDAGWAFRRSYLQFRENRQRFPGFLPNHFYYGALQVAVSTIPDGYKWLSGLLGMKGDMNRGMNLLEGFLQNTDSTARLFHQEALFFYGYLKFYIRNQKTEVFELIRKEGIDLQENHLFAYLAANLSLNNQQSAETIRIIESRRQGRDYFQTPIWDFELAHAKLHHLDSDAGFYFERFLNTFKGRFYVRDALQKLSWFYYLQGDTVRANEYRLQILRRGSSDTEADKLALREARQNYWPHPILLKARLLNDGGYYHEALALLHGKSHASFTLPSDQVEFSYRAGRLYDDAGNKDEAMVFYQEALRLGQDRSEYFAARAAWQIGLIYEERNDCKTAAQWYRRCLSFREHDFKNSLDQRAKAGLERCKTN